ncbi:SDR family oxidoreductase [Mycobacterium sp. pW049]|uniref:SDR family oxidoreductase n=1 Tax=[Mycobacterium] bulgaricum TaxID=3238985 RepID=UPI00351BE7A5
MKSPRSVLLTGASRGIGLAIGHRLAQQGFGLTLAGRDKHRLEEVARDLHAGGAADVAVAEGDVRDDTYLHALVETHRATFETMDALLLNAGAGAAGSLSEFHIKRFDKQISLNLRAPFLLVQNSLPLLRASARESERGGKVIAMASITGMHAEPELAGYGAAKAALISLCRSINAEENVNGVQATALAPGYVATSMSDFKHDVLPPEQMIPVSDVVEIVDALLRMTRRTVVSEIALVRSGISGPVA